MKKLTLRTITSLLAAVLLITAVFPLAASGESISGSNWMSRIPDDAYLCSVNIPGTHDSGMYNAQWGMGYCAETQQLDIKGQLEAGVRIFDIRLRYGGGTDCYLCHGAESMCCDAYDGAWGHLSGKVTYDMVLTAFSDFLEEHQSETIIATVQHEYKAEDEDSWTDKSGKSWYYVNSVEKNERDLDERLSKNEKSILRLARDRRIMDKDGNQITMGDARGRVLLFPTETGFGYLMDGKYNDYEKTFADKWRAIKPLFDSSPDQNLFAPQTKESFRACFTSCTGQFTVDENGTKRWNNIGLSDSKVLPSPGSEAGYMTKLLMNYDFEKGAYYGWVSMDMVTNRLAKLIYQTNDFNSEGRIHAPQKYISEIRGFCYSNYGNSIENCFDDGYILLIGENNFINVNPKGDATVIGYKETTDPGKAITDIKGSYDDEGPNGYEKVKVGGSLYNYFTRHSGSKTKDTYLFVSHSRNGFPIVSLQLLNNQSGENMVREDKSGEIFNLQKGFDFFYGLNMVRMESQNEFESEGETGEPPLPPDENLEIIEIEETDWEELGIPPTAAVISIGNTVIPILILMTGVIVFLIIKQKAKKKKSENEE